MKNGSQGIGLLINGLGCECALPGRIRTLINDMCPRTRRLKWARGREFISRGTPSKGWPWQKLAGPDTHWGGHGEAADRISNSLASRPSFHQQHVHPRKETAGRLWERGRGSRKEEWKL